jgi:hypothetical protein
LHSFVIVLSTTTVEFGGDVTPAIPVGELLPPNPFVHVPDTSGCVDRPMLQSTS